MLRRGRRVARHDDVTRAANRTIWNWRHYAITCSTWNMHTIFEIGQKCTAKVLVTNKFFFCTTTQISVSGLEAKLRREFFWVKFLIHLCGWCDRHPRFTYFTRYDSSATYLLYTTNLLVSTLFIIPNWGAVGPVLRLTWWFQPITADVLVFIYTTLLHNTHWMALSCIFRTLSCFALYVVRTILHCIPSGFGPDPGK